ncbi:MAG: hypothetical protein K5905_01695 [Roseibium sp.]|uniref:hypothetical protein n=1 Tax=Roseibium sp. TaxID=1936156 RepID=UPI0026237665|nr:hypothetical protein [Roseibium sp.]MCV0424162.1 hypothetical protein [Roseibium sp.]
MVNFQDTIQEHGEAIGLSLRHTSTAMDLAAELQSLASRSKHAGDMELNHLVAALKSEITNANRANIAIQKTLSKIEKAALEAVVVKSKLDRYALWQTPAGASVYRLKADRAEGDPMHYVCPVCYQNAKISILQGSQMKKDCMVCDKSSCTYRFEYSRSVDRA